MGVARTVLATLAGTMPCQRLQVALCPQGDGRLAIELCEQHHAEGIGWFDQRALRLDPAQFRQLQAVLGLRAADWVEGPAEAPATIPFPGPRLAADLRATGSDSI